MSESTKLNYGIKLLRPFLKFRKEELQIISKKFFKKIINTIVKNRAASYYPPRAKKVLNLISRFRSKSNQKSTLGGCIFEKRKNFVHVTKEF